MDEPLLFPPATIDITDIEDPIAIFNALIVGLGQKLAYLSDYIDRNWDELTVSEMIKLNSSYSLAVVRFGRLLRCQHDLWPELYDPREAAINQALDEVGKQLGIDI